MMIKKYFENVLTIYNEDHEKLNSLRSSYVEITPEEGKVFKDTRDNRIIDGTVSLIEENIKYFIEIDKEKK